MIGMKKNVNFPATSLVSVTMQVKINEASKFSQKKALETYVYFNLGYKEKEHILASVTKN
jgi:DNA repair protein RadC